MPTNPYSSYPTTPLQQTMLDRTQPMASYQNSGPSGAQEGMQAAKIGGQVAKSFGANAGGAAIPLVGAATGIYGMYQNKGGWSNVLNGAQTGASFGTMVMPGMGTLIGAGIGAGVGGIQNLWNMGKPSQAEKDGRTQVGSHLNDMMGFANAQQGQGAMDAVKSGQWHSIDGPLGLIVTRDALIKSGADPATAERQAEAWMHNLSAADKQGPAAVDQAFSPIKSFLERYADRPATPATRQSIAAGGQPQPQFVRR